MATADDLRGVMELDRVIHEPARLLIVAILYADRSAAYPSLLSMTRLTSGNLHTHLRQLEKAGYIQAERAYRGKRSITVWHLSEVGHAAFEIYQGQLKQIADHLTELIV